MRALSLAALLFDDFVVAVDVAPLVPVLELSGEAGVLVAYAEPAGLISNGWDWAYIYRGGEEKRLVWFGLV